MPWTVVIHHAARSTLARLDLPTRQRIGAWRILFTRDDEIRVIAIDRIGARGDVYK